MKLIKMVAELSMVSLFLQGSNGILASTISQRPVADDQHDGLAEVAVRPDYHEQRREQERPTIDPETGLVIVTGEGWMADDDVPWSTPVLIRDEDRGDYVAVLDRDYEEGIGADILFLGVLSNWSRHSLEVYGYGLDQFCVYFFCEASHPTFPVEYVDVKVGSQVFQLPPEGNNHFLIEAELAQALRAAPLDGVKIRIATTSNWVSRPLGQDTVEALHSLYEDAVPIETTESVQDLDPNPEEIEASRVVFQNLDEFPSNLPVVDEMTWRRQESVRWSEVVVVHDEFEGYYLAVLDHAYGLHNLGGTRRGILSNWRRDRLAILVYELIGHNSYSTMGVSSIDLTLGEHVFHLEGRLNRFPITDELATALSNPLNEPPILSYQDADGNTVSHEIGPGTVAAWRTIYQPEPEASGP
jgi:hypothetical protein